MADSNFKSSGYTSDVRYSEENQFKKNMDSKSKVKISPFQSISHLQELSVIEAKSDESLDKDLFTINKVFTFFNSGFIFSLFNALLIFLHKFVIITFLILNEIYTIDDWTNYVVRNVFVILIAVVLMFSISLSQYAVGDYTKKALNTLYLGKMISGLIFSSLILLVLFLLDKYLINNQSNLFTILKFINDLSPFDMQNIYSIINQSISQNMEKIYYEIFVVSIITTFVPFTYYFVVKVVFVANTDKEYKEY